MTTAIELPSVDAAQGCFHCGEPLPNGQSFTASVAGVVQPMCCPGCVAVAELIDSGGLSGFYQQRTAYNQRPDEFESQQVQQLRVYDEPALAGTFCTTLESGSVEARILVDGISCAACTWLIESSVLTLPGVQRALVNMQDARLEVCFDPAEIRISDIFVHLARLGYTPRPYAANIRREQLQTERRDALKRLAVAGLGMMQVGMFAIALHAGELQGIAAQYEALLRWVSLPVAAFVVGYSARVFFVNAWRHLKIGALIMDLPIALAIGLAFAASVWATLTQTGQVYFDSVVMFTFFLLLGRYLEQGARQRYLTNWTDTEASLPAAVTALRDGQWSMVPRLELEAGDRLLVKPGEVIAADAIVMRGKGELREDAFTGESLPRSVGEGDSIFAGTINLDQELEVQAQCDYHDSRLALLLRSVQTAQGSKPALATLADRIAAWFVAGILAVASLTFLGWLAIDASRALWVTLSVLVISCPCALALATPAALTAAASALRDRGVIVNAENALEALAGTTHLVFDKTGTLTEGDLNIRSVECLSALSREEVVSLAAGLQQHSTHPIAGAFVDQPVITPVRDVTTMLGAGIEAEHAGKTIRMGSEHFCRQIAPTLPAAPPEALYWVALCARDEPLAWFGFHDPLRTESCEIIRQARAAGIEVELLTGDASSQATEIARTLSISRVFAGVSPQEKWEHVQSLQAEGAVVCMVGDGLNDAPVLSAANVSFAVTGATALAQTQASLVITDGDLHTVMDSYRIARGCLRIMRQNFAWALAYNLCAIPLAAAGLVAPWLAAVGMSASSLLVVLNALRLAR